jgi:deoxyribodipyrimidine photolyase-related protein
MSAFLVFPNQLFKEIDVLKKHKQVFLLEEPVFFYDRERDIKMHKLKLLLHMVSMEYYKDYLEKNGIPITIVSYNNDFNKFYKNLKSVLDKQGLKEISFYHIYDHLVEERISSWAKSNNTKISKVFDSPYFINTIATLNDYVNKEKKNPYFQTTFYKYMRYKCDILIDRSGNPEGGSLTYDKYNRKAFDLETIPKELNIPHNKNVKLYIERAKARIEKEFSNHYGYLNNITHIAFNYDEAGYLLNDFIDNRLSLFGDYQDAYSIDSPYLYHSGISHALNIGILEPMEVVKKVEEVYYKNPKKYSINSIEGFIRQVLGWREFSFLTYTYLYSDITSSNFMNSQNILGKQWYTAKTGWIPVDLSIEKALNYGYLHHIERLMLMGNIMNLMKFHPNEVYKWYMELFIDSYDWVMTNNVYSMILFADGGLTTSKPYIASDNYLVKMSNGQFKRDGKWDVDFKTLFYNYIATAPIINFKGKKVNYFATNGRIAQMYYLWKKKESSGEDKKILSDAKAIMSRLSS